MAKSQLAETPLPILKILLVEDNSSDAFVVNNLLDGHNGINYQIHLVTRQKQAIEILANEYFDVCLLDLTLPDTHGFSALIDIQDQAPDMPVLILTGVKDTTLAKRAVARGAQDYLLKDDLAIESLARSIDYAIERKQLEMALFVRANYDTLTGIANRDMFINRLELALARAERSGVDIAVLFIDLDKFKPINDIYGHDAGDEALKTVAQRVKNSLRNYDTAARFGGDEFAVLLDDIDSPRNAANIAQKIITELSAPIIYKDKNLELGASIGIAFIDSPILPETALQHADLAMYHAKKEGGNFYRFYSENMHDAVSARLDMEDDLRTALAVDELQIYYQPYFASDGVSLLGVEALLRWQHPDRGLVCAQEFIAAAESCRLMPEITQFMCRQLYHDIAMFNAHSLNPLNISINLSAAQLYAPNLIGCLAAIASKDFLGENRLVVEVHEEAITPISGACFMVLSKLHDMEIGLHLDHFGLNILPLTTLCELPFSLLKIDMSIIKNISKSAANNILINAAITLAHQLGMKVGAVGVEKEWQMRTLQAQSCDALQGFLTAHPMTAKELVEWLGGLEKSVD